MQLSEVVEKYLSLRDKRDTINREAKEKAAQINANLEKIEGYILKAFEAQGVESVKTASGTAYRATQTSATVADWDSFLAHVVARKEWELLERRCAKKAVETYTEDNGTLPPGVNWRAENIINVRRS